MGFTATRLGQAGEYNALKVGEVAEAMFSDYQKAPDLAEMFWRQSLDNSNPDPDHPTRELHTSLVKLLTTKKANKRSIDPGKFLAACIRQMRKFRKYGEVSQAA